jgi:hypothetical protein
MSKDILLAFARGGEMKQSYIVVYDVSPDNGEIRIHSCETYSGMYPDDGFWVQVCKTKEDIEADVSDEEMKKAVEAFMSKNKP